MLLDEELDASTYASLHDAHVLVELPAWADHADQPFPQMRRVCFHVVITTNPCASGT